MNELRTNELASVCSNVIIPCRFRITLSSECTKPNYCEHQIEDNYDDYLQELGSGCYE